MTEKDRETIQEINKIDNSGLRDLIWLIYSPQIAWNEIDAELRYFLAEEGDFEQLLNWYNKLPSDSILEGIKTYPLGKYAESLVTFYLENNSKYELLENNLQLIRNNQTLGEIDFLFYQASQLIHLELAIKFYLRLEGSTDRYLGPKAKDELANKLHKLTHHQSQLAIANADLLPAYLDAQEIKPKVLIKGVLFFPWKELDWPLKVNEGWWLRIKHLSELNDAESSFKLLVKKDWIYPFAKDTELLKFQCLEQKINERLETETAIMLLRYNKKGQLLDRGFVVKSSWPNL